MQLSEVPLVVWVFVIFGFLTVFGRRLLVVVNGAVIASDLYTACQRRAENWNQIFLGGQNRARAGRPHNAGVPHNARVPHNAGVPNNAGEGPAGQNMDHHSLAAWLSTLASFWNCVFVSTIVFFAVVACIDMQSGSEHLPTLANFTVIPLWHLVDSRRNLAIERSEHYMLSINISVTALQQIHELQGETDQAEFLLYLEVFKVLKNNYTTPMVLSKVIPELQSQKTILVNEASNISQKLTKMSRDYKNLIEEKKVLDSQVSDLEAEKNRIVRLLTNCKKASKQIEEERAPSKCLIA